MKSCHSILPLAAAIIFVLVPARFSAFAGEGTPPAANASETKAPEPPVGILEFANTIEFKLDMKAYFGEMRIAEILPHGTTVVKGAVIAKISAPDMEDALIEAKTNLTNLENSLKALNEEFTRRKNDDADELERTKHSLDVAEEALSNWESAERAESIKGAELSLQGSRDRIEDQKDELAQLDKLYEGNDLAKESQDIVLRRARRELKRSEEYFAIQEARHARNMKYEIPNTDKEKKYAVQNAKQALLKIQVEQALGHPDLKAQIGNTENAIRQAKKRIDKLLVDAARLTFYAPFDGVAIMGGAANTDGSVKFKSGDKVGPDTVVATIANPAAFSATFKVPAKTALKIKAGLEANVAIDALELKLPCIVSAIGIDGKDNLVSVAVKIDAAGNRLFPGMAVKLVLPPE